MKKFLSLFLLLAMLSSCAKTPVALKQFYTCNGTDPGGEKYTVTLETRKTADNVYDVREIGLDGTVVVVGQGFIDNGKFIVTLFFSQGYGVGSYAVQGNMLSGKWLGLGTGKVNPEVCTPAAKAPEVAPVAPAEAPDVDSGQSQRV